MKKTHLIAIAAIFAAIFSLVDFLSIIIYHETSVDSPFNLNPNEIQKLVPTPRNPNDYWMIWVVTVDCSMHSFGLLVPDDLVFYALPRGWNDWPVEG